MGVADQRIQLQLLLEIVDFPFYVSWKFTVLNHMEPFHAEEFPF